MNMTIPTWCLLAFAAWTLLTLGLTVGTYRWGRILTGRAGFRDYGDYKIEGAGWYCRGMRAHANCVENLPIFGAIVFTMWVAGLDNAVLNILAIVVVCLRIPHTIVHVCFEQTNTVVGVRSILYNSQFAAMSAMIVIIAVLAAG